MDVQIEIEPQPKGAFYRMPVGDVVVAFRAGEALLASHGIDRDQAAAALGLSPITLKAYARGVATVSHRTIPAQTLDRIRDLAVDAYWKAAAWPYRIEIGGEEAYLTPVYTAHDDTGFVRDSHSHPLRMQEVADKLGGSVRVTWSVNRRMTDVPPLDAAAALRSRWRTGVWQLRDQFRHIGRGDADAVLCDIADCCRYTLWTLSTEYRPWQTQVTTSMVERIEAAVADIERGDEIQPWESAVAKAMADLEGL
ncbi:hypothetical protein CN065_13895 [Sinorhizobium meliloti]|uniref:hypothetical protein n=1 Tax=Rhizobium meliloti TaxID=382 RepID=UPI000B4A3180|nr:hypothetical protein [Sinorhizobium meliloti]ASP98477.1 hypothetical protein CDO24_14170 [Sinorhizobium meliloti]MQV66224.1 hypothetical protein [Sinorhizobium meliloti]RVQ39290.1 hypothetical protein CN065_13895 [Sinorhizobium meliloti]